MPIVVVHKSESVVVAFGGEADGIGGGEGAGCRGDCAERSVVIVGDNTTSSLIRDDIRDVLVAVVSEEIV